MARNPDAVWDPMSSSSGGLFTGEPKKAVAHKTQGATYAGARSTYLARSLGPHFTIAEDDSATLYQHLDTGEASSALANGSGGVQTNRDGAIQVEIVGFSATSASPAQLATFIALQGWLEQTEGIPRTWPAGRPPQTSDDGYGQDNGYRDSALWDSTGGWYGHSQVPENTHWDPAFTDEEWAAINQGDDDMPLSAADLDAIRATVREQVLDIVRKDGISGAADANTSTVDDNVLNKLEPLLEQLRAGSGTVDVDALAQAVANEIDRRARDRLS